LHSRKVVGWAMQSRMDAALVQAAVGMALGRRRPSAGLIHHADRGVNMRVMPINPAGGKWHLL